MFDILTRESPYLFRIAWLWKRFDLTPLSFPDFTNKFQQNEVASHLEDVNEMQQGVFPNDDKTQKYGNLLFLLQSEPRHIAHLCRLVSMAEIDSLLQTVMFTIYGNQYESREEHLLLTMFQVRFMMNLRVSQANIPLVCLDLPIRQHPRLLLSSTRQHPGLSNDDHLHPQRTWSEFSQVSPCGKN